MSFLRHRLNPVFMAIVLESSVFQMLVSHQSQLREAPASCFQCFWSQGNVLSGKPFAATHNQDEGQYYALL